MATACTPFTSPTTPSAPQGADGRGDRRSMVRQGRRRLALRSWRTPMGQYREDFNRLHRVSGGQRRRPGRRRRRPGHAGHPRPRIRRVDITPQKPQRDLVSGRRYPHFQAAAAGPPLTRPTTRRSRFPRASPKGHCMAVIGWDAAADKVTIWNPWGNNPRSEGQPARTTAIKRSMASSRCRSSISPAPLPASTWRTTSPTSRPRSRRARRKKK